MKSVLTVVIVLFCLNACKQGENKKSSPLVIPAAPAVDPITALKIGAAAATIVGFGFDRGSESKQRRKFQEIMDLLNKIDKDIQILKNQNAEIIKRLDELPFLIRTAIKEELKINELNNRYNRFDAKKQFLISNLKMENVNYFFPKSSQEYLSLWEDLFFIAKEEFRVGYSLDILKYAEFTLIATNNDLTKYVQDLLKTVRIEYLNVNVLKTEELLDLNAREIHLYVSNNRKYFSDNLNSIANINELIISPFNDKPISREQVMRGGPGGDGGSTRTVPIPENVAFNSNKNQVTKRINSLIKNQKSLIEDKLNLLEIIKTYNKFIVSLDN